MNKQVAYAVLWLLSVFDVKVVCVLALDSFKRCCDLADCCAKHLVVVVVLPDGHVSVVHILFPCGEVLFFKYCELYLVYLMLLVGLHKVCCKLLAAYCSGVELLIGYAEEVRCGFLLFHLIVRILIVISCNVDAPVEDVDKQHCYHCSGDSKPRVSYLIHLYEKCADAADRGAEAYGYKYAEVNKRDNSLKYYIQPRKQCACYEHGYEHQDKPAE